MVAGADWTILKNILKRRKEPVPTSTKNLPGTLFPFSLTVQCAGWSMLHGRLETERFLALAGPPLGGQTASLTPLSPLYSTGPCCPV